MCTNLSKGGRYVRRDTFQNVRENRCFRFYLNGSYAVCVHVGVCGCLMCFWTNPSGYPNISDVPAQIAIFGIWCIRDADIPCGERLPLCFSALNAVYEVQWKGVGARYSGGMFLMFFHRNGAEYHDIFVTLDVARGGSSPDPVLPPDFPGENASKIR